MPIKLMLLIAFCLAPFFDRWVYIFLPRRYTRGILSRPFRPLCRLIDEMTLRLVQFCLAVGSLNFLSAGLRVDETRALLAILIAGWAFPVDDVLFGDDERWKRRWRALRNKVKWLMTLPFPEPEPRAA